MERHTELPYFGGKDMGRNKGAPLDKHITIRVTEREFQKITDFCAEQDVSNSEYLRALIRVHLGLTKNPRRLFDDDNEQS